MDLTTSHSTVTRKSGTESSQKVMAIAFQVQRTRRLQPLIWPMPHRARARCGERENASCLQVATVCALFALRAIGA